MGFEFAKDHPDLVLEGEVAGIEVGTRAIDGPWDIHGQLEEVLSDRSDLFIVLTFDGRPLKLGQDRVKEIVEEIVGLVKSRPIWQSSIR